jgi:hypothetical protein
VSELIINDSVSETPYFARKYFIGNIIEEYVCRSVVSGNKHYIAVELVSMKSQQSLIRVYSRKSDYFSTVKAQFNLNSFVDSGLLIRFVGQHLNYLVVRCSNYFRVYKVQEPVLMLDAWGLSPQGILSGYSN